METKTQEDELYVCPKTGKVFEKKKTNIKVKWPWIMPIIGFFALVWFLIRVIPKPKRITYPCQQIAAPLAWNFIGGFVGFLGLSALYIKAKKLVKSKMFLTVISIVIVSAMALIINLSFSHLFSFAESQVVSKNTPNSPIGVARGVYPGRVVWAYDSGATSWDGVNGCYWEESNTNQEIVNKMVSNSLNKLVGKDTEKNSWKSIFKYFNSTHGNGETEYIAGEKIAIKVNLNQTSNQNLQANASITSPQVLFALLNELVTQAGVDPTSITVFDASRSIPDLIYNKCSSGVLKGINFEGFTGYNGRGVSQRDTSTTIHWSYDVKGNLTYLPKCVTQAKYFINLATLKGHNLAGVTLCAKNNFGTIMTDLNGQPTNNPPQGSNIHGYVTARDYYLNKDWDWSKRPLGSYNALVDLMGHKDLGEKTLLYIIDSLYPAKNQSQGIDKNSKWQMSPFNNDWASSIFFSLDGVAIDSVGYDFLNSEPTIKSQSDVLVSGNTADNYLIEAALADNPPSKTFYDSEGDGVKLKSLGVHENWNNSIDKKYSRNLGSNNGIELLSVDSSLPKPTQPSQAIKPQPTQTPKESVSSHIKGMWLMDEISCPEYNKRTEKALKTGTPKLVAGKFGKAIEFSPGYKSWYTTGDKTGSLSLKQFTISCWMKVKEFKWADIIEKCDQSKNEDTNYALFTGPGGKVYIGFKSPDMTWNCIECKGTVEPNKWQHISATYDGRELKLYINGILNSTLLVKKDPITNSDFLSFGSDAKKTYYNGVLDEVALFDTALGLKDIKEIMKNGLIKALKIK